MTIRKFALSIFLSLSVISVTGCGEDPIPSTAYSTQNQAGQTYDPNQELQKIPQILDDLNEIKTKVDDLDEKVSNLKVVSSGSGSSTSSSSGSTKTDTKKDTGSTTTKDTGSSTDTTTDTKKDTASSSDKAQLVMDKVAAVIVGSNYIEAAVHKYEKNLNDGKEMITELNLWGKKGGLTKVHIIKHSKENGSGTKMLYTSGSDKVKIRPGGALSLITTTLDMDDERLTSPNEYTPDETSFYGLLNRLTQPGKYKPEITGKATVEGSSIYILKVTPTSGVNELDSRIAYEYIGFDPKTFHVRLWEAYTADSSDPFMRVVVKSFKTYDTLDEDTFKV